jgi:cytochrome c peroxidase
MASRIVLVVCALVVLAFTATEPFAARPVLLAYPSSWPEPVLQAPLTEEGIALGRRLFHDPVLSRDSTISCSSCHLSYTAFSHVDHRLSHGIGDSIGTRNAPALMNLAWNRSFMWDGAVNHIDVQALAPISHPAEMGEDIAHVVAKLQRSGTYPAAFRAAFGEGAITGERLLKALSQFQLTLVSAGSKYDRVIAGRDTFSSQELSGHALFLAHCNSCHTAPLFTNGGFASNGLPVDPDLMDLGRMRITGDRADSLLFKVPTLRNIEYSRPYMHDGRFRTLREVLTHYSTDFHVPGAEAMPAFSSDQRTDLLAFLLTLSDRDFVMDPAHAAPRPTNHQP